MNNRGGTTKGVNLIGTATYHDGITKEDGKKMPDFYVVQAEVDLRDPANNPDGMQKNPNILNSRFRGQDGNIYTGHGWRVTTGQMKKMVEAAGPNNAVSVTPDGKTIEFALKADLMKSKQAGSSGYIINTAAEMGPSDYGWSKDMKENQAKLVAEAKAKYEASRADKAAEQANASSGPVAVPQASEVSAETKAPKAAKKAPKASPAKKKTSKAKEAPAVEAETPSVDNEFEG